MGYFIVLSRYSPGRNEEGHSPYSSPVSSLPE
jgi:hypothetical protein